MARAALTKGTSYVIDGLNLYQWEMGHPADSIDSLGLKVRRYDPKVDKSLRVHQGTETYVRTDDNGDVVEADKKKPYLNCHGYSFAGGLKWLTNTEVMDVIAKAKRLKPDEPAGVGDIVVYGYISDERWNAGEREFSGVNINHSAIVTEVDKEGFITRVQGKHGKDAITDHHPDDPYPGEPPKGQNDDDAWEGYGPDMHVYRLDKPAVPCPEPKGVKIVEKPNAKNPKQTRSPANGSR